LKTLTSNDQFEANATEATKHPFTLPLLWWLTLATKILEFA
jgi:hypothetical protein